MANGKPINAIHLPYVSISYIEPIVYFDYHIDVELGFPEMREVIASAEKLSGHKPYVTFSDVRGNLKITNEGKKIVSDLNNMPLFRGTAVLVRNDLYKFAANFLGNLGNPKYPLRAFTSHAEAIAWLLTLPLD